LGPGCSSGGPRGEWRIIFEDQEQAYFHNPMQAEEFFTDWCIAPMKRSGIPWENRFRDVYVASKGRALMNIFI